MVRLDEFKNGVEDRLVVGDDAHKDPLRVLSRLRVERLLELRAEAGENASLALLPPVKMLHLPFKLFYSR